MRFRRARPARRAGSERAQHVRARHSDARAAGRKSLRGSRRRIAPSLFWGNEHLWAQPSLQSGRSAQPDARQQGPGMDDVEDPRQSGPGLVQRRREQVRRWFPLRSSGRQASFYDPKTQQFTLIDTCYSTHHLQFDNDANETRVFQRADRSDRRLDRHEGLRRDEGRAESAVGWCGQVLDTNGDGKITKPWNQVTAG